MTGFPEIERFTPLCVNDRNGQPNRRLAHEQVQKNLIQLHPKALFRLIEFGLSEWVDQE
jgi:hypothetical protein